MTRCYRAPLVSAPPRLFHTFQTPTDCHHLSDSQKGFPVLIPLLAEPTLLSIPAIASGLTYEVELATAVDTSGHKAGAIVWRLHSATGANTEIRVKAYRVWPYDPGLARFQETPGAPQVVIETFKADGNSAPGELITTDVSQGTPDQIYSPALRVVLEVAAVGGTSGAGTLTVSAALMLYAGA
jgi:hypothetical protein